MRLLETTQRIHNPEERFVFINAWNEWAEGAPLSPTRPMALAILKPPARPLIHSSSAARPSMHTEQAGGSHPCLLPRYSRRDHHRTARVSTCQIKLFVTTPHSQEQDAQALLQASGIDYHLLALEKRGQDVLPFLKIMNTVVSEGMTIWSRRTPSAPSIVKMAINGVMISIPN